MHIWHANGAFNSRRQTIALLYFFYGLAIATLPEGETLQGQAIGKIRL